MTRIERALRTLLRDAYRAGYDGGYETVTGESSDVLVRLEADRVYQKSAGKPLIERLQKILGPTSGEDAAASYQAKAETGKTFPGFFGEELPTDRDEWWRETVRSMAWAEYGRSAKKYTAERWQEVAEIAAEAARNTYNLDEICQVEAARLYLETIKTLKAWAEQ